MVSSSVSNGGGGVQILLLILLPVSSCFLLPLSLDATSVPPVVDSSPPKFSFSFDFSDASRYDAIRDLKFEGDASVSSNQVDLTCSSFTIQGDNICTGRMSYNHPVPFYDDTTLASFNTSFIFVIQVDNEADTASGGMAFFVSGYPSTMPPNSGGDQLGLLNVNQDAASGAGQFIAVEFDMFQDDNLTDPTDNQIRIDTNCVQSQNYKNFSLPSLGSGSRPMTATIQFNSITGLLVASLRFRDYPSTEPIVQFSQMLPDPKSLLPRDVAVGFSAATNTSTKHQILAWSFNSTLASSTKGHKNTKAIIVGVIGALAMVLVVWFILSCWKWTTRHRGFEKQGKQEPTQFEYRDLEAATDHFLEERKLGEGLFGVVYRGYLKKLGCDVAVKKMKNKSQAVPGPDNKDFYDELNIITAVKHRNLVKLVGWCRGNSWNFVEFMCWCWNNKNNKLFLVYELVPKGSLYDHLHKEEILPWETRYKIVKDITCALVYLHHECNPFILHRDIKPSNILLDDNFNAKLADFGLSRIVDTDSSRILTIPVGTEGYLDPQLRKKVGVVEFSRSSDVYSFGIVLLDIACKKGVHREQVWHHYTNGSLMQAADDKLKGEFHRNEMETVIILGLWCSYPDDSKKRPSMEQVMAVLEPGQPLPDLKSLDTTSASTLQETCVDPKAPSSAAVRPVDSRHE
ncbi:unnamed protein product [Urochloa humidicola]